MDCPPVSRTNSGYIPDDQQRIANATGKLRNKSPLYRIGILLPLKEKPGRNHIKTVRNIHSSKCAALSGDACREQLAQECDC